MSGGEGCADVVDIHTLSTVCPNLLSTIYCPLSLLSFATRKQLQNRVRTLRSAANWVGSASAMFIKSWRASGMVSSGAALAARRRHARTVKRSIGFG